MQNNIQPRILKGFRDFAPSEMMARSYAIEKIKEVVVSYGFDQLETPTLEYEEILTGNIGEDEKLIYRFVDDGKRSVALRYDQTVGACRFIAMNYQNLPMPFKRFQIQNVFRAENTQKGRYREFLQFDADIFGVTSVGADVEMILLTCDIYKALGFKEFKVHISDRAIVEDIPYKALVTIDKLDKIGQKGVQEELEEKGFSNVQSLLDRILHIEPNKRVKEILSYTASAGYGEHVVFDPSIMRAFSYSTGTIWEVRVPNYPTSLLGGERFDSLVSRFSKLSIPGVGFGLGFDRTIEAMMVYNLIPFFTTHAEILICVSDLQYLEEYLHIGTLLREEGRSVEVYPEYDAPLAKQLKYANKKGIAFVLIMGEDEKKNNMISMKDMQTGVQQTIPFGDLNRILPPAKK